MHEHHVLDLFHYSDKGTYGKKTEAVTVTKKVTDTHKKPESLGFGERNIISPILKTEPEKVTKAPEPYVYKRETFPNKNVEVVIEPQQLVTKEDNDIVKVVSSLYYVKKKSVEIIFTYGGIVFKYVDGKIIGEKFNNLFLVEKVIKLIPSLKFINIV